MPTDQWEKLANVVASALDCAMAERVQFLNDVCGDDFALRGEAESLLRFEESARDFIETPAYESLTSAFLNGVAEPVPVQESMIESKANQSVSVQESISDGLSAMELGTTEEAVFESEMGEQVAPAESESVKSGNEPELLEENKSTEPMAAPQLSIESDMVSEQERFRENEVTEVTSAPIPFLESERAMESAAAQEPLLENENLETSLEDEPISETGMTQPEIATAPPAETELPDEQKLIAESELTHTIVAPESGSASEPIELGSEQKKSREDEAIELTPPPTPIFESAPIDAATLSQRVRRNEDVIESGPERRRPEIEEGDQRRMVAADPKELIARLKPVPLPPRKAGDSFEIPAYPAKELPPSRAAIWRRRVAAITAILLSVAMVAALVFVFWNASEAQHQRDVAEKERSRAERINNYLQQILALSDQDFTSVWPIPQNRNTTVTEMLDRVAGRIQKEVATQPDVRGEVLRIIGKAYAAQGDHDAAEKNLRAALQTQTAFYGAQNAEITETIVDLGILLYRREKFAEAEKLLENGVTFLRKRYRGQGGRFNAVKLAHALDRLGSVKVYRGEIKAARAVLEEALDVATQAQPDGLDRAVLTHIKTDLGGLLVLVGDLTKGERMLQEALTESRSEPNAPQWEKGVTLQMLGELALARNHAAEAEENFVAAEDIYRKTLGEKNLFFARNLERRATVSLIENDLSTAEELARKSLALTKECSPASKLPWTDPMMTLSSILLKEGRDAEGEDFLRKTIRICEEQPARNYAAIALAKIRLSQLLLAQKRFTEAENLAFEAHNQTHAHLEPQDPMRKAATNNLVEIYEVQEKHAAARAVK